MSFALAMLLLFLVGLLLIAGIKVYQDSRQAAVNRALRAGRAVIALLKKPPSCAALKAAIGLYQAAFNSLPTGIQSDPTGQALQDVLDLANKFYNDNCQGN